MANTTIHCSTTVVFGYHEVSEWPSKAQKHGLRWRTAFVMDSHLEGVADQQFDAVLFLAVADLIKDVVLPDGVVFQMLDAHFREDRTIKSFEELSDMYKQMPRDDWAPPAWIDFKRDAQLVCHEFTEWWSTCGGPHPYSDSYTIAFFSAERPPKQWEHRVRETFNSLRAPLIDFIEASREPIPARSWWKRVWRLLSQ